MEFLIYILIYAIIIGLSLLFNYYTYEKMSTMLIWLMIFTSFFVWISLIDVWVLILLITVNVIFTALELYKKRGKI